MEEDQGAQTQGTNQSGNPVDTQERKSSNVSFPTVGQKKSTSAAKTLVILGVLLIVAALGFVIFRGASKKSESVTPEATGNVLSTPAPTPEPSATPAPTDKTKVSIQILNATGIAGEAGYLQGVLKTLGYEDIKVGNANSQDQTVTKVTFASDLAGDVVDEITIKLKNIYKEVDVATSSTGTYDVAIETGLRKGVTPKPSTTPTPTSTSEATSSGSTGQ